MDAAGRELRTDRDVNVPKSGALQQQQQQQQQTDTDHHKQCTPGELAKRNQAHGNDDTR